LFNISLFVAEIEEQLKLWRREFHKFPEASWTEYRTACEVVKNLETMGYEVLWGPSVVSAEARMGLPPQEILEQSWQRALKQGADPKIINTMQGGFTGVLGLFKTCRPGPTVALRFELDALEIAESDAESHYPFREKFSSLNPGIMHACGHDGHLAIGLGVAKILIKLKEHLAGTIKLIFQPAEEGVRGAQSMVEAGVLDDVDYFISGHIGLGVNNIGEIVCGSEGFLDTSKYDVEYIGSSAHAGHNPENGKNALLAAATAIINLHAISRHGQGSSRVNVGTLNSGNGRNLIPSWAKYTLETRGETEEINKYMVEKAKRIIQGAAEMYDVSFNIRKMGSAHGAVSNDQLISLVAKTLDDISDVKKVHLKKQFTASEDVTNMMRLVQDKGGLATYLLFGSEITGGHHQGNFDFDEKVLPIATRVLLETILRIVRLPERGE